jgi:flavodoxin
MNIASVYFSRGGKTRKIAKAIAEELKTNLFDVKKENPDQSLRQSTSTIKNP